jgi:methionine biosynthesis protein MetW
MTQLRSDLNYIASLVSDHSRVLDLGCGNGELLHHLTQEKKVDGRGIEISQAGVSSCVQNGLSVIQGNAETDLCYYPDQCFDYVISSQVLQVTHQTKMVLDEMLRVGHYAIVSIPNFGHWKNRLYLTIKGKMPVTKALSYQWYETPNIHFCTVTDFELLCKELGAKIQKRIFLNSEGQKLSFPASCVGANVLSDKAIYLLQRKA